MDTSVSDRAAGAATSVGLHFVIALVAIWPLRQAVQESRVAERPGPEIFFVDALPQEAPAAAGLNPADASDLWKPAPSESSTIAVGGVTFDIEKVMSRATLLFPFLTPGLSLERFGLSPAFYDEKRLRMPLEFAHDRSWSRRSRWKPFEPLAGITEAFNPDGPVLGYVVSGFSRTSHCYNAS